MGEYLKQLDELKLLYNLNEDDLRKYEKLIKDGTEEEKKDAENKLVIYNYKFVIYFAKQMTGKGVGFEELFQAGMIGLLNGIRKYDYTKGYALTTYCSFYIKKEMYKLLNDLNIIQIPEYMQNKYMEYLKEVEKFVNINGRDPKEEEICNIMNISKEELNKILDSRTTMISFDLKINDSDDNNMKLQDIIPDENQKTAFDEYNQKELQVILSKILNDLPQEERIVIEGRFGLNNQASKTLQIIAEEMGVSTEKVRKLEESGLRKLRAKPRQALLQGFLR